MKNDVFQELVLKHLSNMSEDINQLKGNIKRIETRMENEVVGKIRVLFDGFKAHDEMSGNNPKWAHTNPCWLIYSKGFLGSH